MNTTKTPSSIAANKKLVNAWAAALSANDTGALLRLYAEDIHITTMGHTLISGTYGPEQVKAFVHSVLDVFPKGLNMQIHSMTAEDDRVCVEATATGTHVSGVYYEQDYHFVFRICDGRIRRLTEYLDTEVVTDVICAGKRPQTGA